MSNSKELRSDLKTSQDLSLGALSYTTSIGRRFKLEQIIFRGSVAITETITITLDSKGGANYDTIIRVKSLSNEQNFIFVPDGEVNFQSGDEIKIQCTNANLTGVLYCTIKCSEILQ
jgi:hypothetical protein